METIDRMQNGDIQQLRNPIAPISLSDSRGLSGGRGRLALMTDESQLYTNENGQLCLMTPVEVISQDMSQNGTPLTVDFEKMTIKHGEQTFRFPASPNFTASAPLKMENNEISLKLSDSFILEGSMGGDENATPSLALKNPIEITGNLPSDARAPLTFNFQTGEISRDGTKFPISPTAKINPLKINVSGVGPITIHTSSLSLYEVNNLIYLNGFIRFSNSTKIVLYADVLNLIMEQTPTKIIGLTLSLTETNTFSFMLTESDTKNILSLMTSSEIPQNTTLTLNFSHIIGTV